MPSNLSFLRVEGHKPCLRQPRTRLTRPGASLVTAAWIDSWFWVLTAELGGTQDSESSHGIRMSGDDLPEQTEIKVSALS